MRSTIILIGLTCSIALMAVPAVAQDAKCLYNDSHFHIQDFKAEGPHISDVMKMMNSHVCRSTMTGLAITLAEDPLIDGNFAPTYYTQTDAQALYYNAIQDVLVAHKFLALPQGDRERADPLMSAFNLKDARAGEYIKKMVRLYPGVWSGFGEIHFKKQEFSEKIAGGPPSLYSPSIDAIFNVIGEMGAVAVVHCDHDSPGNLALRNDPGARVFLRDAPLRPQYLDAFNAFMKRHRDVTFVWAHFMGNGRDVKPYPEHWKYVDELLGDPAFKHVYIDISWGPLIAPYFVDTPEHLKMTADLVRKYPERFLYGSDKGATVDWDLVKKSYDAWAPLWNELGPSLTKQVTQENYVRLFDQSRKNMRAWETLHSERLE